MKKQEKWGLVTGASAGIGKDFAKDLAERGWNVLLVARREERLKELQIELERDYRVKVDYVKADLSLASERENVIRYFEKYPITFLVNNAGILSRGPFEERGIQESYALIDLNVTALVHLTRSAIIHFKKLDTECHILNVGSLNSYIATGDSAVYSGSKAFVKSFNLALSEELKVTNIRCTCFCPGATESDILVSTGITLAPQAQKFMMRSDLVARLGIEAALNSKTSSIPGYINKFNVFLSWILPETWMTSFSSWVLRSAMKRLSV